jgi:hypothetical protein
LCIEFSHSEKDGGACGLEPYSLHTPGSFGGGPWALRPKRLQWLNHTITTGFKIAAFRKWVWQILVLALQLLSIVLPAKAGICVFFSENRDARFRGHDGEKESVISSKVNLTRRAFRPFFTILRILIGAKPGRNFPSILFQRRKAVPV